MALSDPPVNLDTIFIARDSQLLLFHEFLRTWRRLLSQDEMTYPDLDVPPIQSPVVLIYGENGFGKSTLLQHYHQLAQEADFLLQVGQITDLKDTPDMGTGLLEIEIASEEEAFDYFDMLKCQIACALQKNDSEFKNYHNARKKVMHVQNALAQRLDRETQINEGLLHKLFGQIRRSKLQTFSPKQQLGQALGLDLRSMAKNVPLLLFFDTYERIDEGDPLLRNVMRAAGPRVGWIIAGQDDFWNEDKLAKRDFSSAASYKNHVLPDRVFPVALEPEEGARFTLSDIRVYFAELGKLVPSLPSIDEQDALRILDITLGIPLAVRLIAEIYLRKPDLNEIMTGGEDVHQVVEKMIHLYFCHVPDIPDIRAKLYGLASLRRSANWQAVQTALKFGSGQEGSVDYILLQMHRQYGFVLAEDGQPSSHENVRHFLRQHLRESAYCQEQLKLLKLLQQTQLEQLDALEKQRFYPDLFSRFADDAWIGAYLDVVEALCWVDLYQAVRYSLAFLLVASFYRDDACAQIVSIMQPFDSNIDRPYYHWWQIAMRSLLDPCEDVHHVASVIHNLEELERLIQHKTLVFCSPLVQYTEQLYAILSWQKGEVYRPYDEQKAIAYYQKALASFYQGKEYDAHLAQLFWVLAYDQSGKQAYRQSIEYLEQALQLKPDFAEAHYNLANAYYQSGLYDRALVNYYYAIELEPTHVDSWKNLGNTQVQRKAYQRAIDDYTQALRLDPQDADLYFNRAFTYKKILSYQRALKDFTVAIDLRPLFIGAYVNRGNTYATLKDYTLAANDYKKASELAPDDIHPAWMYVWIRFDKQRPGVESASQLEKVAALEPKHYVAAVCRGLARGLKTKDLKAALTELDQAVIQAPEQWDPYFWRGLLCAYLGRFSQARRDVQQAVDNGLPALLLLPLYWLKQGRPDFFIAYAEPILSQVSL